MDWKQVLAPLISPPLYPLYLGLGVGIVTILAMTINSLAQKRRQRQDALPKSPQVQFLEDALQDDAPRKPNPNYSYAEFQRDLHDKGLTFEEIYEKCGGVFPQKPPPPPPPVLPMSIHEIQGQNGEPGFKGVKGDDGPKGADGRCPDRMTQLQQWFEQRGKDSKVGRIVPPPPNPYPIIHKIYIRGRR